MSIAFFGLGAQEILILAMGGGCVVAFVVPVIWLAVRNGQLSARVRQLEEENCALRDHLGRRPPGPP